MDRLKSVVKTVNLLTGKSSRHNKSLRNLYDWSATLQKFLSDYQLYGRADAGLLLENAGDAKFDLTSIAHNSRNLKSQVKNIKNSQITSLFEEVVVQIENMRRILINPSLRENKLHGVISDLKISFEKMHDTLSTIEYM